MSDKEEKDVGDDVLVGPFSWWKHDSVKRIAKMAAESARTGGWIEDHLTKDGGRYLWFFDGDGKKIGGENDSYQCPIVCPP